MRIGRRVSEFQAKCVFGWPPPSRFSVGSSTAGSELLDLQCPPQGLCVSCGKFKAEGTHLREPRDSPRVRFCVELTLHGSSQPMATHQGLLTNERRRPHEHQGSTGRGQTLFQSFLGIFENIQSLIAVGTLEGKENMSLACIYYGCHGLAHSLYSPL